jgi:hypothetical protein
MHFLDKDIVFQVGSDLCDPCIRTNLSFWILRALVHGVPRDAYDPWRASWNQGRRDRSLEVLVPPPLSDSVGRTIDCYSRL